MTVYGIKQGIKMTALPPFMFEPTLWPCSKLVFLLPLIFATFSIWLREDTSFSFFRGTSESVGFWKQYCYPMTYSIFLWVPRTEFLDSGLIWGLLLWNFKYIHEKCVTDRILLLRGIWNTGQPVDNVEYGQICVVSMNISGPLMF